MEEPMTITTRALAALAASLPHGGLPRPGIVTAGQPAAEDFVRLSGAGCTTVLDLCAPEEPRGFDEPAAVAAAGLTYRNVAVRGSSPDDGAFAAVRALLRDEARRPLLFHCRSANRVGGLLVPYLILDEGMGQAQALAIAARVGLRDEDLARAALDYVARQRAGVAR
jgi:protein tyrosine phosphatase (PTP) superfamily phosphohydrolase (DUF442 family)